MPHLHLLSTARPGSAVRLLCLLTRLSCLQDVKTELSKSMETFGFLIVQALVTDIEPDKKGEGRDQAVWELSRGCVGAAGSDTGWWSALHSHGQLP